MVTRIPARMIETTGVTPGSYSAADITVNSAGQITSASTNSVASSGGGPKITSIVVTDSSYTNTDDTAVGLSGGYIKITGTGFSTGCSIIIGNLVATSVSFISSTEVRAQVPAQSAGTYTVYLVNLDGGVGIRVNGLNYSSTPTWTTTSPLGDGSIDSAISVQLAATSNSAVTYALQAGSTLPAGLSLSSSGLLTGTVTSITVDTTYNFTVVATDQESQDTPQAFSITITVNDPNFKNTVLLLQADTAPTIISDASANNFDLTVAGDARASNFTPYGTGWSNYFDGTGDYLSFADSAAFDLAINNFTIECWVYTTSFNSQYNCLLSQWDTSLGYYFYLTSSTIRFGYQISGSNLFTEASGLTNSTNTWIHLAVVRNSNSLTIYKNGTSVGSGSITGTINNSSNQLWISGLGTGSGALNNTTTHFGYISNIRLVNGTALYTANFTPATTTLTAVANTSLLTCHANRFLDGSTNNFTITRNGDAKVVSFNPFNITNTGVDGSAYFDGTGDYLSLSTPVVAATGDFTIEGWFYLTNAIGTRQEIIYQSSSTVAGDEGRLIIAIPNTGYLSTFVGGTNSPGAILSSEVIKPNTWYHFAYTRNSNTFTQYLNGVIQGTASGTISINQNPLLIGGFPPALSSTYWFGYLSDIRIVNGTAVYTANFTPPTQPLTAIANTSLLTLQYDQPHNNHTFLDASSNQFVVTRSGNTTQGTFSPFSQTGWGNYFGGDGNYLSSAYSADFSFSTGEFSIECWANVSDAGRSADANKYGTLVSAGLSGSLSGLWGVDLRIVSGVITEASFGKDGSNILNITSLSYSINQWHHIVACRSGSTLSIFIDGTRVGTMTYSSAIDMNASGSLRIASSAFFNNYQNWINGYISNLRIIKGSSAYNAASSSITVPTIPLTSPTNTKLLTCQSNRFIDANTQVTAKTITLTGSPRVVAFSPFNPTASWSAATHGGSAYFDGTGDYLTVPHDPAVVLNNEDWTIEFWVYPTVDARADVICKGNGGSYVPYMISLLPSGQLNFNTSNSGSGHAILLYSNTGDYRLFQWNHIAVTKSGSTIRIFCQGALVATGSYSGGAMTNSLPLGIGAGSDGAQRLTGYMSHVRIIKGTALYTSAFTVPTAPPTATTNTQLLLNFTDAAMRDSRGLAVLETVGDAKTSTVQVKYGTGSMRFDGTGDYLVPYNPNTNTYAFGSSDFTIEFWVRFGALAGNQIIYDSRPSATDGLYPMIYANGTSLRYYVNAVDRITSNTLSTNVWYHVAVARSGTSTKMFIDGTQAGSTYTDSTVYINATNRPLIAQNGTNLGAALNGYIDDLRVTTGIARYTANFTPPAAKFLAR